MRTQRPGFTLIEMMVAMALTVFVMVILSQCFVAGLETFGGLKAVGDMQEELRTTTTLLRSDLGQDHFEGKRRLSDPLTSFTSNKIREGFFVIGQGYPKGTAAPMSTKATEVAAAADPDGIGSFRATDHWLHFSVKRRGNSLERFFAAPVPAAFSGRVTDYLNNATLSADAAFRETTTVFHSAWAEIAYFLMPTGTTGNTSVTGGAGMPLYALYRCQWVVPTNTTNLNASGSGVTPATCPNIAATGTTFLNPNDLAISWARRTFNPYTFFRSAPATFGTLTPTPTLVLSNVISFQVEALTSASTDFVDINLLTNNNRAIPFDTANYSVPATALPAPPYPASSTPSQPTGLTIKGLQIIIRIWDPKSQLTRQVTLLQDM